MRLRNIKGAEQFIADSKYVIQNPEDYLGKWNTFFENDHPLHIEIGMGKGKFIHTLASQNPSDPLRHCKIYHRDFLHPYG